MEVSLERPKPVDASTSQSAADELVKLICKLRWIGMEDEADRLSKELTRQDAATDSVVASPHATD